MEMETEKKPHQLIGGQNIKTITGILTFIYCLVPVIQFHVFDSLGDKFNNHIVFVLSMEPFELMQFLYTGSPTPYFIQFLLWLFYWWVTYRIVLMVRSALQ